MLKRLASVANELDRRGFYNEADAVTKILCKIAQQDEDTWVDQYNLGEIISEGLDPLYDWKCSYCGVINSLGVDVCSECGRERNIDEEIEENPLTLDEEDV